MIGTERRDRVVILGACVLAFIVSASFDLIGSLHDYLDHLEQPQVDRILTALGVALVVGAIGLAWYSRRRLADYRREFARRVEMEASLRRTEQRLADAIESMSDGVVLLDADQRFVMCNSRYREIFSQLASRLTPGTPVSDIVGPSAGDADLCDYGTTTDIALAKMVGSGQIIPDAECRLATGRWIRISDRHTGDGGLVGIRTDITSLKLNEEALRKASGRAEAASLAKSQFLAHMSHELRSPLNVIIGFAEMIESRIFGSLGSPKYEEYIRDIRESGQHLLALINDILDLSKIEADKYVLNPEPMVVPDLIRTCQRAFRLRAEEVGVRLEYSGGELPRITADERAIKQVLINLLSNAIKFTPSGGTITLQAAVEGPTVMISVADTGEGIPAADLPRIGQPFERSVKPDGMQKDGTGLGLALSRRLVELHRGSLEISSQEGVGTQVTMRLPLSLERQAA
ncbi:PAS domain-containing sensor histidine kinase [Skermanella pratensis]|uniref:sensor histidine kinase n=1 Tax=Skermanella pratensis TaxID=2233999 RepID=UPI001301684C|nr:PAS domain-containing sensor histidine kinase [Skermanella pratensis]